MYAIYALSLHLLFLALQARSEWCFWPNGTSAADIQCGSEPQCCASAATCLDNGICRDPNNHPNGSLTPEGNNLTGLYETPSCTNQNFTGCREYCLTSTSGAVNYMWACNDAATTFCCASSWDSGQRSCCLPADIFTLAPTNTATAQFTTSGASTAVATPSGTSTSEPSTAEASASASPSASSSAKPKLSEGSKIGLGVGIGVGLPIIALIVTLWMKKERYKRAATTEQAAPFLANEKGQGRPEPDSNNHANPPEIMSEQLHELQSRERKHELMSTAFTELPGNAMAGTSAPIRSNAAELANQRGHV